ncbi:cytochrome P450 [Pseudosulfitobacter sp. DSM 107133]|uniref:cytochrome P450 n=1 Tax=Pseudosulfitobacter sp. DSM 107133 TaxID=2883100 RepID=UPI0013B3DFF5|nr:cytochrome P450 [Pseudosulfitobacter sp. DSM 107133]UOA26163.1 Putative cytochrome P450 132 [Pseudosulfitobacter sp. DSM 107133]
MSAPRSTGTQPAPWLIGIDHLTQLKRDQLGLYARLRATHGDVVRLRLGPYRSHLLFHPDHIEALLTRQWAAFIRFRKLTTVIRQWNGDSLLLAEGDAWRARRRKVMPAFQTRRLPDYGQMAVQQTEQLCAELARRAENGRVTFDTDATMARLTLDIAARTLFGAEPRANGAEIERAIQTLSETAFRESTSPTTLPDWLPMAAKRRKRWAIQVMDDLVSGLVRDRIERGASGDQSDLLSTLIAEHDGDFTEVRNDVMSLLIAGHETSGALLSWLFAALATEAAWLDAVQSELAQVLSGRPPSFEDLAKLPILRATIDETLRLYPPAYTLFLRQATEPVELLDLSLRTGDLVQIIPYLTQRDPRFFDAPDQFDPARFLQPPTWPQFAYLPFGAGPRVCIGQNFGLMEACLVAATVLQRLTPMSLEAMPPPLARFSLRPDGGLPMSWQVTPLL